MTASLDTTLILLIKNLFIHVLQLYNVCPWLLEYLPGPHQTMFSNYKKITDYLRGEIIKHKEDRDPSNPRDFIDNYLTEMENVQ